MSKYIIEVPVDAQYIMINGVRMGDCYTQTTYIADIEELTADYINEHYGSLQDDAYQRGLDEAWEAARRISILESDGGYSWKEMKSIFGTDSASEIYMRHTATEAINKIKAYEEKQKADDEIKVGDEVEVLNSGSKYLIAWIAGTSICGFAHDGMTCHLQPSDVRKTGRHFDIAKILEEMRE